MVFHVHVHGQTAEFASSFADQKHSVQQFALISPASLSKAVGECFDTDSPVGLGQHFVHPDAQPLNSVLHEEIPATCCNSCWDEYRGSRIESSTELGKLSWMADTRPRV